MDDNQSLTPEELTRYARHLVLPEVGREGQERLKTSSVLLVGAGGLGSPVAMYLAAAGLGRMGIVDFDRVDVSNLQRQIIHTDARIGRKKVESAREAVRSINPFIQVDLFDEPFTSENALSIAAHYDLVIDGTDNFATRYLVNDACVLLEKPNCYGSIYRFEGQASVFGTPNGPCYRCLYPQPPHPGMVPSCAEGGVLGVLPGMVGTIQATEAIKVLLGIGRPLVGRLLLIDALDMKFRELAIRRDPECPVCGDSPTITEPIDYHQFCGVAAPGDPQSEWDLSPDAVNALLGSDTESALVLDVREPHEYDAGNLGGKLIPLGELAGRTDELDPEAKIIVHCQKGGRSAKAVQLLRDAGYADVWNLQGGIERWWQRFGR